MNKKQKTEKITLIKSLLITAHFKQDAWGNYKRSFNGKEYRYKLMPINLRYEVKSGKSWIKIFSIPINTIAINDLTKALAPFIKAKPKTKSRPNSRPNSKQQNLYTITFRHVTKSGHHLRTMYLVQQPNEDAAEKQGRYCLFQSYIDTEIKRIYINKTTPNSLLADIPVRK